MKALSSLNVDTLKEPFKVHTFPRLPRVSNVFRLELPENIATKQKTVVESEKFKRIYDLYCKFRTKALELNNVKGVAIAENAVLYWCSQWLASLNK